MDVPSLPDDPKALRLIVLQQQHSIHERDELLALREQRITQAEREREERDAKIGGGDLARIDGRGQVVGRGRGTGCIASPPTRGRGLKLSLARLATSTACRPPRGGVD